MRCPFCKKNGTDVVDSRQLNGGETVKRRRQCNSCNKRFTTHESYHENNSENEYNQSSNKRDIYHDLKRAHGEDYLYI